MKLAAIGLTAVLAAAALSGTSSSAMAGDKRVLGVPLYAGPNTVIVTGGGRIYGQPPRTYRYGDRRYGTRHDYRPGRHYGRGAPGYNRRGYDRFGYDREGYDRHGYDRQGYDQRGFDRRGYDRRGHHRRAYGRERHQPTYGYTRNPARGTYGGGYRNRDRDRGPRITILGATYRSIDGRACDAFAHVHKKCDGDNSCKVKASNKICGDPDRGRLKVLEVTYACGNRQFQSRTPERSSSRLRCR